jgi:protein-tyrosine phosphatase
VTEPRTRLVLLCPVTGSHWYDGVGPPACDAADHDHQGFEVHVHQDRVTLPDGATVTAVSFDPADPHARSQPPDHGVYLDERWSPPWPHTRLDWPDFGVPADPAPLVAALEDLRARAAAGERVELGCLGGHGRTGTALACLAVLAGHPADGAVAWVRATYCAGAVETPEQEAFVAGFGAFTHPG